MSVIAVSVYEGLPLVSGWYCQRKILCNLQAVSGQPLIVFQPDQQWDRISIYEKRKKRK